MLYRMRMRMRVEMIAIKGEMKRVMKGETGSGLSPAWKNN